MAGCTTQEHMALDRACPPRPAGNTRSVLHSSPARTPSQRCSHMEEGFTLSQASGQERGHTQRRAGGPGTEGSSNVLMGPRLFPCLSFPIHPKAARIGLKLQNKGVWTRSEMGC